MKYLIAGLGNPGPEYFYTRHNIGFLVLDALAEESGASFKPDRLGDVTQVRAKNKILHLLKPNTYMNLSGKAIRYWLQALDIPVQNLLVVTDDLSLPTGRIRIRTKGSDGGHNGLKSIQELLQTQDYARLRFGISDNFPKGKQVDYVLGEWTPEEQKIIKESIPLATEAIKSFALSGPEVTMGKYNKK